MYVLVQVVYDSDSNMDRTSSLLGPALTSEISLRTQQFDRQFEEKFKLQEKGYSKEKIAFAQAAMSNMLGECSFLFLCKFRDGTLYHLHPPAGSSSVEILLLGLLTHSL